MKINFLNLSEDQINLVCKVAHQLRPDLFTGDSYITGKPLDDLYEVYNLYNKISKDLGLI